MSKLLIKPHAPDSDGCVHRVTPESAGWTYVGFEFYTLSDGQSYTLPVDDREHCVVVMSGKVDMQAEGIDVQNMGERMSLSEHVKPVSLYIPMGQTGTVTAKGSVEIAVCSAPGGGEHAARVIADDDVGHSVRGSGTNTRYVYDILPDSVDWAHSLLVVEVRTPSGNWSSYPPHRHDEDDMPNQSLLEETYYHRVFPEQGFAFQRVYTDDCSLDETMAIGSGDVVLVPKGYHPYGVPHGYEGYYLNVMAGPQRVWKFHNHPDHAWLMSQ